MFQIILLAYLAYRNSLLAKIKDQNVAAWALFTVLAYIGFMMVGIIIVLFGFCWSQIDMNLFSSLDPKVRAAATAQLQQIIEGNPLHFVTIQMVAFGGYLLIRFLLERKPGKKEPEVHWMDKLGEQ